MSKSFKAHARRVAFFLGQIRWMPLLCFVTFEASADSYVPANARVTQIASSQLYGQNAVIFKLDQGTSDCAAGSYIYYYGTSVDDLKAMYATILAAYMAGTPVIVHFGTGTCVTDGIGVGSY